MCSVLSVLHGLAEGVDLSARVEVDRVEESFEGIRQQRSADEKVVQTDASFEEDGREQLWRQREQGRERGHGC